MTLTGWWQHPCDGFTRKLVRYEVGGSNYRAVLEPNLFQSASRSTFQQDRDPQHTTKATPQ